MSRKPTPPSLHTIRSWTRMIIPADRMAEYAELERELETPEGQARFWAQQARLDEALRAARAAGETE